ncbi:MAG: hypothetical protein ACYS47_09315 [Planctomycetota bacterium]|jgi:hypothetical protein
MNLLRFRTGSHCSPASRFVAIVALSGLLAGPHLGCVRETYWKVVDLDRLGDGSELLGCRARISIHDEMFEREGEIENVDPPRMMVKGSSEGLLEIDIRKIDRLEVEKQRMRAFVLTVPARIALLVALGIGAIVGIVFVLTGLGRSM